LGGHIAAVFETPQSEERDQTNAKDGNPPIRRESILKQLLIAEMIHQSN
jgi:hypothetical protein